MILVGGGSAGSVVANRLAMDYHNYKVLLLESGGNPFPLTNVPGVLFDLMNNPEIDWSDKIAPQRKACQAFKDNVSRECYSGYGSLVIPQYAMGEMRGRKTVQLTLDSEYFASVLLLPIPSGLYFSKGKRHRRLIQLKFYGRYAWKSERLQ